MSGRFNRLLVTFGLLGTTALGGCASSFDKITPDGMRERGAGINLLVVGHSHAERTWDRTTYTAKNLQAAAYSPDARVKGPALARLNAQATDQATYLAQRRLYWDQITTDVQNRFPNLTRVTLAEESHREFGPVGDGRWGYEGPAITGPFIPGQWHVIDNSGDPNKLQAQTVAMIEQRLGHPLFKTTMNGQLVTNLKVSRDHEYLEDPQYGFLRNFDHLPSISPENPLFSRFTYDMPVDPDQDQQIATLAGAGNRLVTGPTPAIRTASVPVRTATPKVTPRRTAVAKQIPIPQPRRGITTVTTNAPRPAIAAVLALLNVKTNDAGAYIEHRGVRYDLLTTRSGGTLVARNGAQSFRLTRGDAARGETVNSLHLRPNGVPANELLVSASETLLARHTPPAIETTVNVVQDLPVVTVPADTAAPLTATITDARVSPALASIEAFTGIKGPTADAAVANMSLVEIFERYYMPEFRKLAAQQEPIRVSAASDVRQSPLQSRRGYASLHAQAFERAADRTALLETDDWRLPTGEKMDFVRYKDQYGVERMRPNFA